MRRHGMWFNFKDMALFGSQARSAVARVKSHAQTFASPDHPSDTVGDSRTQMIRLIATDFDGTIYEMADGQHVPELLDWLRRAQAAEAKWVVCSGRVLNEDFEKALRPLNGDPLPDYIVTVEREIQVRHNDWYRPDDAWNSRCRAVHDELFAKARAVLDDAREWVKQRPLKKLFADEWSPLVFSVLSDTDADEIHRELRRRCEAVPGLTVVRMMRAFRFAHRDYSKGSVLGEIARRLGLARHEVFAVGDHFNDLSMLDGTHAGLLAAPSNAIPEVKAAVLKAGGYVASEPSGRGVLEALRFFENAGAASVVSSAAHRRQPDFAGCPESFRGAGQPTRHLRPPPSP